MLPEIGETMDAKNSCVQIRVIIIRQLVNLIGIDDEIAGQQNLNSFTK